MSRSKPSTLAMGQNLQLISIKMMRQVSLWTVRPFIEFLSLAEQIKNEQIQMSVPDGCWYSWKECVGQACPAGRSRQMWVLNCTRHGGSSEWSEWSGCSSLCGRAVSRRSRSCTAPRPRFGGCLRDGPAEEKQLWESRCRLPLIQPKFLPSLPFQLLNILNIDFSTLQCRPNSSVSVASCRREEFWWNHRLSKTYTNLSCVVFLPMFLLWQCRSSLVMVAVVTTICNVRFSN